VGEEGEKGREKGKGRKLSEEKKAEGVTCMSSSSFSLRPEDGSSEELSPIEPPIEPVVMLCYVMLCYVT
jgi:hypothetical protein